MSSTALESGTWTAVRDAFPLWTARFEGRVRWLYLDSKGIVTTGVGWALPTLGAALRLPWTDGDGGPAASPACVQTAYQTVLAARSLAGIGGGQAAWDRMTPIRLPVSVLDAETLRLFDANDEALPGVFAPGVWAQTPADAQLVAHSMAYAMGIARMRAEFTRFIAAMNRRDYRAAANECHMSEVGNAPLRARNQEDYRRLLRAAEALAMGGALYAFWTPPAT